MVGHRWACRLQDIDGLATNGAEDFDVVFRIGEPFDSRGSHSSGHCATHSFSELRVCCPGDESYFQTQAPSALASRLRWRRKVLLEPLSRQASDLFKRAWLFKQVGCTRDDLQLLFCLKLCKGSPV